MDGSAGSAPSELEDLERLKLPSIVRSNLDEFPMVRVAGLQDQYLEVVPDEPNS